MKTCVICGSEFPKGHKESLGKYAARRYCSQPCRAMGKSQAVTKVRPPCRICGEPVNALVSRYCSAECSNIGRKQDTETRRFDKVEAYIAQFSPRTEKMQALASWPLKVINRGICIYWNPLRHCHYKAEVSEIR